MTANRKAMAPNEISEEIADRTIAELLQIPPA
jgi:hypothetical protein